ncbi:hypothetical protein Pmani_016639 [Petrolisthes manimaculis]|uniref:Uncharacterized protein n=1 Tax=Petrolisthes manimaculis TaxID=1843537 RepID=A0AAE1PPX5_9EUCA|nr:hypothetical protein Pmani_016639 [Petrolisthes manimaculis]
MGCRSVLPIIAESQRCRALLLSSLLLLGITLLSIPNVPERFLGIRSPEQVITYGYLINRFLGIHSPEQVISYLIIINRFLGIRSPEQVRQTFLAENTSLESNNMLPLSEKQHSLQKRHIPHKFWARARPHNKFVIKKHGPKSPKNVHGEKQIKGEIIQVIGKH